MTIALNNSELGTIAWTLPEKVNNRINEVKAIWIQNDKKEVAEKFERQLQEDITRFLAALTGSLTAALHTQAPGKLIELIDQRMQALLIEITAKVL